MTQNKYMTKSKVDFIVDLLENGKINSSQKEKLFALTANEIRNFSETELEILKEIKIIKNKIGLSEEPLFEPEYSPVPASLPNYIDPRNTSKFLLEYNQNIFLKSTTHTIDSNLLTAIKKLLGVEEYDFKKHQAAIQSSYNTLKKNHSTIKGLIGKIDGYIYGKAPWSSSKIKMGWSSSELEQWCENNPNHCPNPEEADLNYGPFNFNKIKINDGISIKDFNELVLYFKREITIRSDNSILDLCKKLNFQFKNDVTFNLDSMTSNIDFFTDVEKLAQAYQKIITMCIKSSLGVKPIIKVDLFESKKSPEHETEIVFTIHHINSKFQRSAASLNRYGTDFTGLISGQLNGLCNWELEADFGNDKFGKISLWPKNEIFYPSKMVEGVKFYMIFYR